MTFPGRASLAALSILGPAVLLGQSDPNLSITNYQIVSQSPGLFRNNVIYRADLVNNDGPLASVVATATSLNLLSFTVAPGQNTLNFASVPAHSQVTSANTVLLLINPAIPFDLSNLQWTFQVTPLPPVANAGPNQSAKLGSTVMLDGSASTNPSGIGTLNYNWAFVSRPGGSAANLIGPTSVRPTFVLDVPGDYVIELTVSNSGGSSTARVTVSTLYTPPVANAGPNQTVTVGSTVVLNGSGSTDVNGQPLTYSWSLITRPTNSAAALKGATTVAPTFVADKPGTYVAQLIVNDSKSDSAPATVSITTINSPPVANAGHNQLVKVGDLAKLDGSASTDVDGDPLTYKWSLLSAPSGSLAALNDPAIVNPTFTIDVAGTYVAQLIVNDGKFDSKPATLLLTTDTVLPPTANPGPNQTVVHRSNVTLNGSGTDPQGLPLTFQWALLSKPDGSAATLSGSNLPTATFFADLPGTYVAQLIVSNPYLDSQPATVTITTTNTPPLANAGPNQTVMVGSNVTLDGSGSSDADHDGLTWSWSLLSRPAASNASLSAANTVSPMFVADVPGIFIAQLIVNDGFVNSSPATVTITSFQTTKITLTPNPLNMSTAAPGTLTIKIAAPAGPDGQVINLTSFGPEVASVPPSVTVAAGDTAVNVNITPGGAGTTAIYATAPGFVGAFATVNVTAAVITIATDATSLGPTRSTNGTITLSVPAPAGGLAVSLSSTPAGVVDAEPPVVTIPAGSSTATLTATGLTLGTATITASAPGFTSGTTNISVVMVGFIVLPPNTMLGLGQTAPFPIALATPAPLGGVTINLASDNPNAVIITPSTVFIAGQATAPAVQPTVKGIGIGFGNISASAPGFAVGSPTQIQVAATLAFVPQNPTLTAGTISNLTLSLSAPAPAAGLSVRLTSDNPAVAVVPAVVTFKPFTSTVSVLAAGVAPGSTVIHAKATGIPDATANVTVN